LYCLGRFQEEWWQRFFQEHEISPHCVVYEELVADYESTVRGVLGFLGLNSEQTCIPPPRSQKQSDALSQEWQERYRKLSAENRDLTPWAPHAGVRFATESQRRIFGGLIASSSCVMAKT
jgi:LPS sulfotransferase NodH